MTYTDIDRRVGRIETRVADIEDSHSETLLKLTRGDTRCHIETGRLLDHADAASQAFTLIMEHLGIPPIQFPPVARATDDEIDAALEEDL